MRSNGQRKNVLMSALFVAALMMLSLGASAQTTTTGGQVMPAKTTAPYSTTAVTSVGLNDGVTSLAADSNGNVYASLQFSNKVVKLNGAGTVVGTFAAGRNPTGLVVDNSNGGVLYVLNNSDNTVSKLKLDGTFVATYPVAGEGPIHAVLYGGVLYIACERSNTLVRMSTSGSALGSTKVGARPVWVAVKSSSSSGQLMTTDDSAATTTTDAEPAATTDAEPTATDGELVVSEDGAMLASKPGGSTVSIYVSCNKADQVWKLSTAGGVLGTYSTPRGPFGIAVNSNGEILVACFWDGIVYRMSASGVSLSKTAVGDGAAGVVAYGNVLAVISNGANSITRLSLSDASVISKELVDRAPLIGTATSSALWVGCTGSGTIAKRAL
jgi:hypothetical protein